MKKNLTDLKEVSAASHRLQYAALPWRWNNELEVMLVSSRETRRWVVPKGWPMRHRKPHDAAAQEALEEAGLVGHIAKKALGTFKYEKRMRNGAILPCKVDVFPMHVVRQRKTWREFHERTTRWFSIPDAVAAVREPDLKELILRLSTIAPANRKPVPAAPPAISSGPVL